MRALLVLALAAVLSACLGSSPDDGAVRFIHASADADSLDVLIDGRVVFASRVFGDTTRYAFVTAEEQDVLVRSSTDRSDEVQRFVANLIPNDYQTLVMAGVRAHLRPIALRDSAFTGAGAHVRLVHAVSLADTVRIDLVGPSTRTFERVGFRQNTGYLAVEEGTYRLDVSRPDGTVLYRQSVTVPATPAYTIILADASAAGGVTLIRAADVLPPFPTD